jgi:hypothetical protein
MRGAVVQRFDAQSVASDSYLLGAMVKVRVVSCFAFGGPLQKRVGLCRSQSQAQGDL